MSPSYNKWELSQIWGKHLKSYKITSIANLSNTITSLLNKLACFLHLAQWCNTLTTVYQSWNPSAIKLKGAKTQELSICRSNHTLLSAKLLTNQQQLIVILLIISLSIRHPNRLSYNRGDSKSNRKTRLLYKGKIGATARANGRFNRSRF